MSLPLVSSGRLLTLRGHQQFQPIRLRVVYRRPRWSRHPLFACQLNKRPRHGEDVREQTSLVDGKSGDTHAQEDGEQCDECRPHCDFWISFDGGFEWESRDVESTLTAFRHAVHMQWTCQRKVYL